MADKPNPLNPSGSLLAADLEGALLLLSYAAQSGMEVDADTARIVARSKDRHARNELVGDELADFYLALQKLSAAAAPVSVAGLRAATTGAPPGTGFSVFRRGASTDSRRAIGHFWGLTIISLLLLIFVQIYWVIGSTALSSLNQSHDRRHKAQAELAAERARLPKGATPESSEEWKRWYAEVGRERNRAEAYLAIIDMWNRFVPLGLPPEEPAPAADGGAMPDAGDMGRRTDIMLARTPFILTSLQVYVLPLLYGLLGAFTYVLRTLSRDVRAFSYTPDSEVRYQIRLVLGMLSGLAVTWFIEPGSGTVQALSPLALAFAAGYSVDILFAGMDRFVAAFSAKTPAAEAKPAKAGN